MKKIDKKKNLKVQDLMIRLKKWKTDLFFDFMWKKASSTLINELHSRMFHKKRGSKGPYFWNNDDFWSFHDKLCSQSQIVPGNHVLSLVHQLKVAESRQFARYD